MDELRKRIILGEGRRNVAYKDTEGIWTIGVGFNLERADASRILKSIGAPSVEVLKGGMPLSDEHIDALLNVCVAQAQADAIATHENWLLLPRAVCEAVIELIFNMGLTRYLTFKLFRKAVSEMDFKTAALELQDSKWFKQVGTRGPRLVALVRGAAKE